MKNGSCMTIKLLINKSFNYDRVDLNKDDITNNVDARVDPHQKYN